MKDLLQLIMPKKKTKVIVFDKNQQRLLWTMLALTVLASFFLAALSWHLSRLDWIPKLTQQKVLPILFDGETLSETAVTALPADKSFDELSFLAANDGRGFAYILKNGDTQQLILNEKAGPLFKAITFMAFSPDGQNFAYTAKRNNKELAVINGVEGKEYDWIFNPRFFSPDNRFFIYKARAQGKDVLVINQQESRSYDRIYDPMLSADKKAMIFFAREGDRLWRGEIPLQTVSE